ncbi:hypothetical protein D3C74_257680 [compost metagenome]
MTIQYQINLMLLQYRRPQLSDFSSIINTAVRTPVENGNFPLLIRIGQILLKPLLLLFVLVFTI